MQLVELQADLEEIHGAGIEVVAVSYDPPETLSSFARENGITYPLLSDRESRTIDAYGLRNEGAEGPRVEGIPHPGTVIVDAGGVIGAKLFYTGYMARHGSEEILAAAQSVD